MNINQNGNPRLKKAKANVSIFLGLTAAMITTTVFMAFATSVYSPGTGFAAGLAGLFCGMLLVFRRRFRM